MFHVNFEDALSDLRTLLATESPLKMMKNAFYFTLKAPFVLKIFKFLSVLFDYVEKRLDRKIRFIAKFVTSQPGKQAITIRNTMAYYMPNITHFEEKNVGQMFKISFASKKSK